MFGLAWLLRAGPVRADGAFPDAIRILLPPGQPQAMTLATNFGLISTSDGGATWTWSCETALNNGGSAYQLALDDAGQLRRVVALSSWGLVHSDDLGCTWGASSGAGQDDSFTDVFVLPAAPSKAWALGIDPSQGVGLAQIVFASTDGAATLTGPLFQAADQDQLLGVEAAALDPATIYLTLANGPDAPSLAVTHDGGAHWTTTALASTVGSGYLRILAVGAASANTVYLRQSTGSGDRLLVTRDGGATWRVALTVSGSLSVFLQRADGTLLVGGILPDGSASGYRSSDAGGTFRPWPGIPHLRGLAERDGILFAAADDTQDGFALGSSMDAGDSFQPRLRYKDVAAVAPCVRSDCQATCQRLAGMGLWRASLCDDSPAGPPDGGAPSDAASGHDAGRGSSGGGCAIAGGGGPGDSGAQVLMAALILMPAFRRPRRPASPRGGSGARCRRKAAAERHGGAGDAAQGRGRASRSS